ncbi:putative siderophore binding protein [Streptomyces lincolnensis]|uniref:Putative siderophore binding protein n=2 Tax=Streptomyces lincolnensis TaxID=1915 RepID=A0A1B1M4Z5_STRLN|nr:putative siderophore binding protein [Streptomyces lincolnensis]
MIFAPPGDVRCGGTDDEERAMGDKALITGIGGREPDIHEEAFVAPTASVIGDVSLEAGASLWYGAVARGDVERISVGPQSNIQDNCTLHADPGFPVTIGARVSVGHNAVVHGATVEDDCLIGMGATVLNGAVIGAGSLVAAQALVPQGMRVPPGSLVAGVPAKVKRELTEEERQGVTLNGTLYADLAKAHQEIHS